MDKTLHVGKSSLVHWFTCYSFWVRLKNKDDEIKVCKEIGDVKISGDIVGAKDISAVAKIDEDGSILVIGSDEACTEDEDGDRERKNCPTPDTDTGNYIQILKIKSGSEDSYELYKDFFLFKGDDDNGFEMDIEGLSVQDNKVYALGSHSSKRSKVKSKKSSDENRKKFNWKEIGDQKNREEYMNSQSTLMEV